MDIYYMDKYIYKVYYKDKKNRFKDKAFLEIKEIQKAFDITKDQITNFYMSVGAVKHDTIYKIEKIPEPIKKPCNITITFD